MAVRAHHDLAGQDDAFLAQDLMTDSASDLEQTDPVLRRERPDVGVILGVGGGRRGRGVIECDGEAFRPVYRWRADLVEDAQNGGAVVVAEHDIRLNIEDVPGACACDSGGPRESLLSERIHG